MRYFKFLLIMVTVIMLAACASTKLNGPAGPSTGDIGLNGSYNGADAGTQSLLAQRTVLFNFNKTDIKGSDVAMLEAHAHYLQAHPEQHILLAGNTDIRGSREYNMGLGEKRATSVANVLLANGASSKQLVKVSYGPEIPVACGQDEAAYEKNRRVDLMYCQTNDCQPMAKSYAHKKLCTNSN
jgi:peptidoglycan-associated lipoprotein